jgi:hypothetical protein
VKVLKMLILTAVLVLLGVAPQIWAHEGEHDSDHHNGDDLTVCCEGVYAPPTDAAMVQQSFQPQVVGCTAIGSDSNSINRCKGVVLGCSESAFVCVPSASSRGKKDCLCLDLLLKAAQF